MDAELKDFRAQFEELSARVERRAGRASPNGSRRTATRKARVLRGSGLTVDQSRELWKAVKDCDRPELPAMSVRILQLLGDYPPTKSGGQSHIHFGFGPVITLETAIDLNDAPRARYRQVKGALTKGARLSAYTPLLLAGQEALVS